jgi:TPR repeat protein
MYGDGEGVMVDRKEALRWIRKAAAMGVPSAMCSIGKCFETGMGVPVNMAEAMMWYGKAAERGDARAKQLLHGRAG